jgi:hypothetical protein
MAINFPTSLDNFTNPTSGNTLDSPSHSQQHSDANDALEALEAKLGVGASPAASATANQVLNISSAGTSAWTSTLNNLVLVSPEENFTISATAASGTVALDMKTTSATYYTSNASANWAINLRGDASTTLDSLLTTNQSITHVFLNTNGTGIFYPNAYFVDGGTVTPKWQGGVAPTAGNASSIDSYSFTAIKTAGTTFTVLASQTQFK